MTRLNWLILSLLISVPFTNICLANQITDMGLQWKIDKAELVFIGTITKQEMRDTQVRFEDIAQSLNVQTRLAHVVAVQVLYSAEKTAQTSYEIQLMGPISEFNLQCCEIGSKNLFFARKNQAGIYESVNGQFGVYTIHNDQLSHWSIGKTDTLLPVVAEITKLLEKKEANRLELALEE